MNLYVRFVFRSSTVNVARKISSKKVRKFEKNIKVAKTPGRQLCRNDCKNQAAHIIYTSTAKNIAIYLDGMYVTYGYISRVKFIVKLYESEAKKIDKIICVSSFTFAPN